MGVQVPPRTHGYPMTRAPGFRAGRLMAAVVSSWGLRRCQGQGGVIAADRDLVLAKQGGELAWIVFLTVRHAGVSVGEEFVLADVEVWRVFGGGRLGAGVGSGVDRHPGRGRRRRGEPIVGVRRRAGSVRPCPRSWGTLAWTIAVLFRWGGTTCKSWRSAGAGSPTPSTRWRRPTARTALGWAACSPPGCASSPVPTTWAPAGNTTSCWRDWSGSSPGSPRCAAWPSPGTVPWST